SCFLGDLLSSLAGSVGATGWVASRTGAILGTTGLILLPLCLLRDLSALKYSSMAGIGAVLYVTVFVALRCLDGTYAAGTGKYWAVVPAALRPRPAAGGVWGLGMGTCVLFNMLSTAFMAHPNAVAFYNELEKPTPRRFGRVVYPSFALAGLVYGSVMGLGFKTFGAASGGLILNNYAPLDRGAAMARFATAVSVIGGQPLLFTGLRNSALSTLASLGLLKGDGDVAAERPRFWAALSVVLLAAATAAAVVTPDVGLVVSLIGSVMGAGMVYSLPAVMYL
ncbi:unnamed protein product, partial [Phaeothamnion confervicola]